MTYYLAIRTEQDGLLVVQKEPGRTAISILVDPEDLQEFLSRVTNPSQPGPAVAERPFRVEPGTEGG